MSHGTNTQCTLPLYLSSSSSSSLQTHKYTVLATPLFLSHTVELIAFALIPLSEYKLSFSPFFLLFLARSNSTLYLQLNNRSSVISYNWNNTLRHSSSFLTSTLSIPSFHYIYFLLFTYFNNVLCTCNPSYIAKPVGKKGGSCYYIDRRSAIINLR